MTQGFQKVRPGQPYGGFPALTYNAIIDVINAYRSGKFNKSDQYWELLRSSGLVEIVNDSGADRDRFQILHIVEPIILPSDDEQEYKARVRLRCDDPATSGSDPRLDQFCILQEPIKNGEVGIAMVKGVTHCQVQVIDTTASTFHYARYHYSAAHLIATPSVSFARILWMESGTGTMRAIVRLDAQPAPSVDVIKVRSSTGESCKDIAVFAGSEIYDASHQAIGTLGAPPGFIDHNRDVWLARTNACDRETLAKDDLVVAMFVAPNYDPFGGDARDLYVVFDPAIGWTKVNKDDELDFLEDQFAHRVPPGFSEGDLRVRMETLVVGGDPQIGLFVKATGFNPSVEQALVHDAGGSESGQPANPVWRTIEEIVVVTDTRLSGTALEKRTSTIKVLGQTDNGWSTAFPSTTCP